MESTEFAAIVDWAQVISAVATLVATVCAVVAIVVAKRQAYLQAQESQEALAREQRALAHVQETAMRERRTDFYLNLLRELAYLNLQDDFVDQWRFRLCVQMLSPKDLALPVTREAATLDCVDERKSLRGGIQHEIVEAVDQLLKERRQ